MSTRGHRVLGQPYEVWLHRAGEPVGNVLNVPQLALGQRCVLIGLNHAQAVVGGETRLLGAEGGIHQVIGHRPDRRRRTAGNLGEAHHLRTTFSSSAGRVFTIRPKATTESEAARTESVFASTAPAIRVRNSGRSLDGGCCSQAASSATMERVWIMISPSSPMAATRASWRSSSFASRSSMVLGMLKLSSLDEGRIASFGCNGL